MSKDKYKLNLEITADTEDGVLEGLLAAGCHYGDGNLSGDCTLPTEEGGAAYSYRVKCGPPDRVTEVVSRYYRKDVYDRTYGDVMKSLSEMSYYGKKVPEHLHEGLAQYLLRGTGVGDFLAACLENNLGEAVGNADATSMEAIPAVYVWLHNYSPSICHGSYDDVEMWYAAHEKAQNNEAMKL